MPREGEDLVVSQGRRTTVVVSTFLIGCVVLLVAGTSGVQAEASKKEQARCEGTRTIKKYGDSGLTNDLPGCPKGGMLKGTDKSDWLDGREGDDEIRGLGARDEIEGSGGSDVIYGGSGDDSLCGGDLHRCGLVKPRPNGSTAEDVIYGGDGNDLLKAVNRQRDKLYCGKGTDKYIADSSDFVSSSCEKDVSVDSSPPPDNPCKPGAPLSTTGQCHQGPDLVVMDSASASATPVPLGGTGGPAALLPAAALLLGSGILTYAILRRR